MGTILRYLGAVVPALPVFFRFWLLALCAATTVQAQPSGSDPDVGGYGTVALTTGGFALGVGSRSVLDARRRVVVEASLGGVSDERETRFSGPEGVAIPSKYAYLLLVPTRVGIEQRLFARQIEDDVRPFVRLGLGLTFALSRPYFADCNGNRRYDRRADCNGDGTMAPGEGEEVLGLGRSLARMRPLLGLGGTMAAGANLGRSRRGLQTVSAAVRLDFIPDGIQLLEPDVRGRQRWFVTPEVSLGLRLF